MRLIFPLSDPPVKEIYCFGVYLTDEGFRVISARDRADLNLPYNTIILLNKNVSFFPLVHFIYLAVFKVLGVGFLQARLTSILFGIMSLIIFYIISRRFLPKEISLFCFYIFGINSVFLFYTRLALAESIFIFFVLIALYFSIFTYDKNINKFISGFFNGLLIFIKPLGISFIISNFFSLLKESRRLMKIILFFSGIIICLTFFLIIIVTTKSFLLFYKGTSSEINERIFIFTNNLFNNILNFPKFNVYSVSPIQSYLGICFIYIIALKIIRRSKISPFENFSILFVPLTSFMISIFAYQPIRYFIVLIPIIILGFGVLINQTYIISIRDILKKLTLFTFIGYLVIISSLGTMYTIQDPIRNFILTILLIIMILLIDKNYWKRFRRSQILFSAIVTFLFIFFIVNLITRDTTYLIDIIKSSSLKFMIIFNFVFPLFILLIIIPLVILLYSEINVGFKYSRINAIIVILLFTSTFFDIYVYKKWLENKEFSIYNASKKISETVEENSVIFGRAAPTLSIGNSFIASSSVHLLPEYILFFKNKNIPIYLLFSNWKEYGNFVKTYHNFLSYYGVKNYILLKEIKVLENYDKYSKLLLFYVSFY